jgi:hypothetical protein
VNYLFGQRTFKNTVAVLTTMLLIYLLNILERKKWN